MGDVLVPSMYHAVRCHSGPSDEKTQQGQHASIPSGDC